MSPAPGVACVIPAYNEASTIVEVAQAAMRVAERVIIVDDGSHDGTAAAVGALPLTVLSHKMNLGKGAALALGMKHALAGGAQAVATIDGDLQHCPTDLPRLLEEAGRYPGAVIIAARTRHRRDAPRLRRFANGFADFWLSWAAGARIADSQSGFRLYPAAVLSDVLSACPASRGFVFESELIIEAVRRGHLTRAVPIDSVYPPNRRASHYRPVRDTAHIVSMVAGRLLATGMNPRGLSNLIPRSNR